jgi:hypothetical protein
MLILVLAALRMAGVAYIRTKPAYLHGEGHGALTRSGHEGGGHSAYICAI